VIAGHCLIGEKMNPTVPLYAVITIYPAINVRIVDPIEEKRLSLTHLS
jgi:hypothetical protein